MEIRVCIEKRHISYLFLTVGILLGINYAIAQTVVPDPGHSADQIGSGTIANTLTLTDDGNAGIGITEPRQKLDVNGVIVANKKLTLARNTGLNSPTYNLENNYDFFRITRQSSFSSSGTALMVMNNIGNVGIGTDDPQYDLDVAGIIRGEYVGTYGDGLAYMDQNGNVYGSGTVTGSKLCIGSDCRTVWPTPHIDYNSCVNVDYGSNCPNDYVMTGSFTSGVDVKLHCCRLS